jgi:cell division protein FtsB
MSYKPYSQSQFNITKVIIIAGLVMVAYMFYSLTVSIYENYQIDQHITTFEDKNNRLRTENLQKLDDYKYYTSEAYIDKIAKQNLGLVNPGEEVIILTETDSTSYPEIEEKMIARQRSMANWSNAKKWWHFVFDDNPFKY